MENLKTVILTINLIGEKQLTFNYCAKYTDTIKDLLVWINENIVDDEDFCFNDDDDYIGYFNFMSSKYGKQKAQLDFLLLKFLDNFDYDFSNVIIELMSAYGVGTEIPFEGIAKICIHSKEEHHVAPHVHLIKYTGDKTRIGINLETLTQIKNEKPDWKKLYSLKERKKILKFLEENREKLCDYYNRSRKGELICEDYEFGYSDRKYIVKKNTIYYKGE